MTDPAEIARRIKDEWELRARSPNREFFVASHEGWDREDVRRSQAGRDADSFLMALDLGEVKGEDVLEIGCGSGRLVPHLAPLFRTYTGIDVARTMVEVARKECASFRNARFFESDGISIPEEARDRQYGFALAAAVLIHCPKEICERLVGAAMSQLRVGGRLRVQMYADYEDPEGIIPGHQIGLPDDPGISERAVRIDQEATAEQKDLIAGTHYVGHRFRYSEAREWLGRLGEAHLVRLSPLHIYAEVIRTR